MAKKYYLDTTGLAYLAQKKLPGKVDQNSDGSGVILNGKAGTYTNTATGNYSTAMGHSTTASGSNSTAMGYSTTASGSTSTAMGYSTTASGSTSTAMGQSTTSAGAASLTIGAYNEEDPCTGSVSYSTSSKGNYVFNVGVGKSDSLKSGFTIDWSGNTVTAGSATVGGTLTANVIDAQSVSIGGVDLETYIQTVLEAMATADIDSAFGDSTASTSSVGEETLDAGETQSE